MARLAEPILALIQAFGYPALLVQQRRLPRLGSVDVGARGRVVGRSPPTTLLTIS
jgi:hypothetical protein